MEQPILIAEDPSRRNELVVVLTKLDDASTMPLVVPLKTNADAVEICGPINDAIITVFGTNWLCYFGNVLKGDMVLYINDTQVNRTGENVKGMLSAFSGLPNNTVIKKHRQPTC